MHSSLECLPRAGSGYGFARNSKRLRVEKARNNPRKGEKRPRKEIASMRLFLFFVLQKNLFLRPRNFRTPGKRNPLAVKLLRQKLKAEKVLISRFQIF